MTVSGFASSPFEHVAESFERIVNAQPAGGAGFSVFVEGECVIDLVGGDARTGISWDENTLSVMFSNTKGLVAVLAASLVQSGTLDPESPVVRYWPEFGAVSTTLTVRGLLGHRAGLSAARREMTLSEVLDHDTVIAELLAQEPLWEPDTAFGYHALTFGTLVDELVRRVDGRTISQMLQDELAQPLGVDAWIGLPPEQEHRVAELIAASPIEPVTAEAGSPADLQARAMTFGTALPPGIRPNDGFNDPRVHQGHLPGANGISNARSLATIWSSTVAATNGVRFLSPDTVEFLREVREAGPSVWGEPGPWPRRGFGVFLESEVRPLLSPTSFGHDGFGGQAGFADPTHRASFGFLTNYLIVGSQEHVRWTELVTEVRHILEKGSVRTQRLG